MTGSEDEARRLGWTDLEVSPLGLGCWAICGPTRFGDSQFGWGRIDEDEAVRAIRVALDGGITFFDTADIYGTQQSERLVGQALAGRRDQVLVATKFGLTFDEGPVATGRQVVGQLREILTSDGRSLAQAALGALWARSERCLPIPGFKTEAQVRDNVGALEFGPLKPQQMTAIADLVTSSFSEEQAQSLSPVPRCSAGT